MRQQFLVCCFFNVVMYNGSKQLSYRWPNLIDNVVLVMYTCAKRGCQNWAPPSLSCCVWSHRGFQGVHVWTQHKQSAALHVHSLVAVKTDTRRLLSAGFAHLSSSELQHFHHQFYVRYNSTESHNNDKQSNYSLRCEWCEWRPLSTLIFRQKLDTLVCF